MAWEILTITDTKYERFRKSHAAEFEVVRSTLPYWLARGALDKSGKDETHGYPAEILTNEAAEHYYAFVWYFKPEEDKPANKFVGFINTAPEIGLRCKSECPLQVAVDDAEFKDAKILGADVPWQGPFDPAVPRRRARPGLLEPSKPAENPEIPPPIPETTAEPPQQETQAPTEPSEAPIEPSDAPAASEDTLEAKIKKVVDEIRKDYKVETDESAATPPQRWLRRGRNVTIEMDHVEREAVRSRIIREVGNFAFPSSDEENQAAKVIVTAFDLPFYPGYSVYRLTDRRGLRSKSAYLTMKRPPSRQESTDDQSSGDTKEAPVCYLANNGIPIIEFNKELRARNELELTRNTIIDYLIYFCRFIYADLGAFTIIEEDADFRWLSKTDERNQKNLRPALRKLLEPVRFLAPITPQEGDENRYYFGAFVCYGRNLSYVIFRVTYKQAGNNVYPPVGLVEMLEDETCVEDLPIVPIIFDWETDVVLRVRPKNNDGQE